MRARAVGMAAFAGAALGGAALGYLAERRALAPSEQESTHELTRPAAGRSVEVRGGDGTLLHAEVGGADGAPALVFVHGMGLSREVWHYQRRDLGSRFRIVTYDQRGHGRSGRAASGDYSLATLGRDLAAVVEACAPSGPVVLVGHSIGSMAVLATVSAAPQVYERVVGVVLSNTAGGALLGGALRSTAAATLGTLQARLLGGRLRSGRLDSSDPADRPSTDLSLLLTRQFGLSSDAAPEVVAFLERQLRGVPPTVLGALGPHVASADLREEAAGLWVPALVVIGERDRLTPPRQGQRLAVTLPHSEVEVIAGVGHTAMLEAPEPFNIALGRFVCGVLQAAA